jgi:hypothetical protein
MKALGPYGLDQMIFSQTLAALDMANVMPCLLLPPDMEERRTTGKFFISNIQDV